MAAIHHLGPNDTIPVDRHVTVIIHRDNMGMDKGYFFDSADQDHGGSGPFDWLMPEAIERARSFAKDKNIPLVVVRTKRG